MIRHLVLLLALAGTLLASDRGPMIQQGTLAFNNPDVLFTFEDSVIPVGSTDKSDFLWPLNGLALERFDSKTTKNTDGATVDASTITISGAGGFTLTLKAGESVPIIRSETDVDGQPSITWKLAKAAK